MFHILVHIRKMSKCRDVKLFLILFTLRKMSKCPYKGAMIRMHSKTSTASRCLRGPDEPRQERAPALAGARLEGAVAGARFEGEAEWCVGPQNQRPQPTPF